MDIEADLIISKLIYTNQELRLKRIEELLAKSATGLIIPSEIDEYFRLELQYLIND